MAHIQWVAFHSLLRARGRCRTSCSVVMDCSTTSAPENAHLGKFIVAYKASHLTKDFFGKSLSLMGIGTFHVATKNITTLSGGF